MVVGGGIFTRQGSSAGKMPPYMCRVGFYTRLFMGDPRVK
jgi:hypothetical protein